MAGATFVWFTKITVHHLQDNGGEPERSLETVGNRIIAL
jgi:hypothetical protein